MLALLGIQDPWVLGAYLLCILSTVLCVVYGLVMWNRGDEPVESEDISWAAHEEEVEEEL
ncbi:MAG: symporter small accessory protein [Phycisphaerae bacterium]